MTENALGSADYMAFIELVNYLWSDSYSGHPFDPEFERSNAPSARISTRWANHTTHRLVWLGLVILNR
jgi:hypothetical protein